MSIGRANWLNNEDESFNHQENSSKSYRLDERANLIGNDTDIGFGTDGTKKNQRIYTCAKWTFNLR
ncbi:hypothetical protein OUZ56_008823 [Daphnia magna]|uniref:Uncharacterized protein n=1 Tax=Daphnia magna TaxID=35525 RepID=A0ABR0AEH4_9CRUS|nr:hypothetical protein OUZ56_008823 [Daphnia magna]